MGYWIIEGSVPHEFDKMDTTILEVVRDNIVTILKTVENQATIENIVRDDLYSGLKSAEYLYGEGKKKIDQYTTSAICLFKISNLLEIDNNVSRKTGDNVITIISKTVKENLADNYVFVRYMGPKFAIVFSGADVNGVMNFMTSIKERLEQLKIQAADDYFKDISNQRESENQKIVSRPTIAVSPKIRAVISTYYKGTSLDGALKKLEEYIDSSNENNIISM
jgi:diguanylate cyclase (GGDEF)-like protein